MSIFRSRSLIIFTLTAITFAAIYFLFNRFFTPRVEDIASFEECASAGYPVMKSYPERCRTPDGRTFVRVGSDVTPSPISISGTITCLPKKDTGATVTLECAFGLEAKDGHYALDMSAVRSDNYPMLKGNESVSVDGVLVPAAMISSDRFQTFDIAGVIAVEKIAIY